MTLIVFDQPSRRTFYSTLVQFFFFPFIIIDDCFGGDPSVFDVFITRAFIASHHYLPQRRYDITSFDNRCRHSTKTVDLPDKFLKNDFRP